MNRAHRNVLFLVDLAPSAFPFPFFTLFFPLRFSELFDELHLFLLLSHCTTFFFVDFTDLKIDLAFCFCFDGMALDASRVASGEKVPIGQ